MPSIKVNPPQKKRGQPPTAINILFTIIICVRYVFVLFQSAKPDWDQTQLASGGSHIDNGAFRKEVVVFYDALTRILCKPVW